MGLSEVFVGKQIDMYECFHNHRLLTQGKPDKELVFNREPWCSVGLKGWLMCGSGCYVLWLKVKGRQFIYFEFVHPDSAGKSNPTTYLEKVIFDILSKSKRGCIFRL